MARTSAINLDANPQADGYKLGGGTTKRTLTISGADVSITGSGTNVMTMPGATATLLGISATATAGSIIFAGSTLMAEDNANFFWDGTNHTLGVGTTRTGAISGTNPGVRIKGTGTTSSTSSLEVQDSGASTIFFVRNDGLVAIGSNSPAAKLQITGNLTLASWTTSGIGIKIDAATYTDSSTSTSGTVTNAGVHAIAQPTIAASNTSVTYTNAATLYIANSPANGTNVTITNKYALWVAAGTAKFDGILLTTKAFASGVVALTDGATPALDASQGNTFTLTAAGDRTIAVPSNPTSGQVITIAHTASGANRTLSLNTGTGGFSFGTDITALTATTSGLTDYIGAKYNAAANKWHVISYVKGY